MLKHKRAGDKEGNQLLYEEGVGTNPKQGCMESHMKPTTLQPN